LVAATPAAAEPAVPGKEKGPVARPGLFLYPSAAPAGGRGGYT